MIEGYKKQTEAVAEAKKVKDSTVSEKPGHTLSDILKDQSESAIFGNFLEKDGREGKELAERLYRNELHAEDLKKLEAKRILHNQKMFEVETLESNMTKDYIVEFAKFSPTFQEIVNLVGPEKSAGVFKKQMRELLVADQDKFDDLSEKMKDLIKYKHGEMSDFDKKIIEECRKNGVSEAHFMQALEIENEDEQREFLQQHVRDSFGFFKKTADFVTFGKWSKEDARNLASKKKDMDLVVNKLNTYIGAVGSMLENVVDGNNVVRTAFATEIIGEKKPKPEPQVTFIEARNETLNEDQFIDQAWEQEKISVNFETLTPKKKEVAKEAFKKKMIVEEKKKREKKGFWASLFSSLFETSLKDKELK